MKKIILAAITVLIFTLSAFTLVNAVNWKVKEKEYTIKFSTSKAEGVMKGLNGSIIFDKNNLSQSNFDVTVDVNTLNTGNGLKNKHAKGEKFLNAPKYPIICLKTFHIVESPNGFTAQGKLTIKEVSRDISIPFSFQSAGSDAVFKGNFEINRKDYGLEYKGVGEVIKIEFLIPVNK